MKTNPFNPFDFNHDGNIGFTEGLIEAQFIAGALRSSRELEAAGAANAALAGELDQERKRIEELEAERDELRSRIDELEDETLDDDWMLDDYEEEFERDTYGIHEDDLDTTEDDEDPEYGIPKKVISTYVAGIPYGGRAQVWADAKFLGVDSVELMREEDNDFDPNAIAIYVNDEHAGYVPAKLADDLSELMDDGQELKCEVEKISVKEDDFGEPKVKAWVKITTFADPKWKQDLRESFERRYAMPEMKAKPTPAKPVEATPRFEKKPAKDEGWQDLLAAISKESSTGSSVKSQAAPVAPALRKPEPKKPEEKEKPKKEEVPAKQTYLVEPVKAPEPEPKPEPTAPAKSNSGFFAGLTIVAILVIALLIAVVAAAGNSSAPANTANTNTTKPAATTTKPATNTNTLSAEEIAAKKAAQEAAAAAAREKKLQELSQGLPYVGLEEEFIDATWLGPHENVISENIATGQYRGPTTTYQWYSRNGKHDVIFSALVKNGAVVKVNKGLSSTNYWPTYHGLPDLYASGTPSKKITSPTKPDPADYDDPEDYADDLRDYQRATGDKSTRYDDPYDDYELNR